MMTAKAIDCLFLDIGGVLLSNGWDHQARKRVAMQLGLDLAEMEERHHLTFNTYEEGKLTLDEYLCRVIFYQKRSFTPSQFQDLMFAQSTPYPEMIELITRLKLKHSLKVAAVNNEGYELNAHRIQKFKLTRLMDFFISSCFVHIRKPDADILRLALNIAQVRATQVIYIENTPIFVQIAEGLGIRSILHTDYETTREKLALLGLRSDIAENRISN